MRHIVRQNGFLFIAALAFGLFLAGSSLSYHVRGAAAAEINAAKAEKLTIGTPKLTASKRKLIVVSAFARSLRRKIKLGTDEFTSEIQELVPAIYSQEVADAVNTRSKTVKKISVKALNKYRKLVNAYIKGLKKRRRGNYIPENPFGAPLASLPEVGQTAALRSARIELSQMRAYDEAMIEVIELAVTPTGAAAAPRLALKNKVADVLLEAFEIDLALIAALVLEVDNRRFSTEGITPWTVEDVAAIDHRTFSGQSREIQQGVEMAVEVEMTTVPEGFIFNYKRLLGGQVVIECLAFGTGDLSTGMAFDGPFEQPECGTLTMTVDTKGRLSGKITNYPEGSELEELQLEGLVRKGGTADVSAIAILAGEEGEESYSDTVF